MSNQIFNATIYFTSQDIGSLAGYFLGRVKDLEGAENPDPAEIARCEAMAGMFISYLPIEDQNIFRELMEAAFQDAKMHKAVDTMMNRAIEVAKENYKRKKG